MSKCCHIGVMYQCITTRQHIRLLCYNLLWKFAENLTHWSYSMVSYQIISYNMLCVWAVFTVTWKLHVLNWFPVPKFYPYLWVREPLEHSESYILRKPRLLCRNCKNFRSQFATEEWEPSDWWHYVSAYPSTAFHRTRIFLASGSPLFSSNHKTACCTRLDRNCHISLERIAVYTKGALHTVIALLSFSCWV